MWGCWDVAAQKCRWAAHKASSSWEAVPGWGRPEGQGEVWRRGWVAGAPGRRGRCSRRSVGWKKPLLKLAGNIQRNWACTCLPPWPSKYTSYSRAILSLVVAGAEVVPPVTCPTQETPSPVPPEPFRGKKLPTYLPALILYPWTLKITWLY